MIFNLKTAKSKKLETKPVDGLLGQDKSLEKQRQQYKYQNDGQTPRQKQLLQLNKNKKDHTDSGLLITEKSIKQNQVGSPQSITQHQLNTSKKIFNLKRNNQGKHPSRFSKQFQLQTQKLLKKQKEKKQQRYMDSIQGQQLVGEPKKIVKNNMHSQLFSNYDSQQDFRNANSSIKKSKEKLIQADSKLYYIFRTASQQKRQLNQSQKNLVDLINDQKSDILTRISIDIQPSVQDIENCKLECPCKYHQSLQQYPNLTMQVSDIDNELSNSIDKDEFDDYSFEKQKSMMSQDNIDLKSLQESYLGDNSDDLKDQEDVLDDNNHLIDDQISQSFNKQQQIWNPHTDTFEK